MLRRLKLFLLVTALTVASFGIPRDARGCSIVHTACGFLSDPCRCQCVVQVTTSGSFPMGSEVKICYCAPGTSCSGGSHFGNLSTDMNGNLIAGILTVDCETSTHFCLTIHSSSGSPPDETCCATAVCS